MSTNNDAEKRAEATGANSLETVGRADSATPTSGKTETPTIETSTKSFTHDNVDKVICDEDFEELTYYLGKDAIEKVKALPPSLKKRLFRPGRLSAFKNWCLCLCLTPAGKRPSAGVIGTTREAEKGLCLYCEPTSKTKLFDFYSGNTGSIDRHFESAHPELDLTPFVEEAEKKERARGKRRGSPINSGLNSSGVKRQKHKLPIREAETIDEVTAKHKLMEWMAAEKVTAGQIKSDQFSDFLRVCGIPLSIVPTSTDMATWTKQQVNALYQHMKNEMSLEAPHCHIVIKHIHAVVHDQMETFYGIEAHFLDDNFEARMCTIGVMKDAPWDISPSTEPSAQEEEETYLDRVLDGYGLRNKVFAITTPERQEAIKCGPKAMQCVVREMTGDLLGKLTDQWSHFLYEENTTLPEDIENAMDLFSRAANRKNDKQANNGTQANDQESSPHQMVSPTKEQSDEASKTFAISAISEILVAICATVKFVRETKFFTFGSFIFALKNLQRTISKVDIGGDKDNEFVEKAEKFKASVIVFLENCQLMKHHKEKLWTAFLNPQVVSGFSTLPTTDEKNEVTKQLEKAVLDLGKAAEEQSIPNDDGILNVLFGPIAMVNSGRHKKNVATYLNKAEMDFAHNGFHGTVDEWWAANQNVFPELAQEARKWLSARLTVTGRSQILFQPLNCMTLNDAAAYLWLLAIDKRVLELNRNEEEEEEEEG